MSDLDHLNPIPEAEKPEGEAAPAERPVPLADPVPVAEPIPVAEVTPPSEEPDTAAPAEEPAAPPVSEAPTPPPAAPNTVYRWSYAEEASRRAPKKGKGVVVYASVMTAVFLLSFGLLLAVLLIDGGGSFQGLIRPGITETENDDEAVVGVEQAILRLSILCPRA